MTKGVGVRNCPEVGAVGFRWRPGGHRALKDLEQLGDLQRERQATRSMLIRLRLRVPRSMSER